MQSTGYREKHGVGSDGILATAESPSALDLEFYAKDDQDTFDAFVRKMYRAYQQIGTLELHKGINEHFALQVVSCIRAFFDAVVFSTVGCTQH